MAKKSTWREKLDKDNGLPCMQECHGKKAEQWGRVMFIPSPRQIDGLMKQVPPGKLLTVNDMRHYLAEKNEADFTCPLTTGIFAWISAHAAEESLAAGEADVTPYWRTLKTGGELNPKYPGGIEALRKKLEAEGHRVVLKGAKAFVADYKQSLASLT